MITTDVDIHGQPQNVLILKGNVAADALILLDELLNKIRELRKDPALQLWHIFSLICASGAAGPMAIFVGPAQQTIEDGREFLELVQSKTTSLSGYGSDFVSLANDCQIREYVKKHLEEPCSQKRQCEAYAISLFILFLEFQTKASRFVWSYNYADEPTDYIKTEDQNLSLEECFWKSLRVRDYPALGKQDPNNFKYGWYGLVRFAKTNEKVQNSANYVTLREPAEDENEQGIELRGLDFGHIKHYPFFVDGQQRLGSLGHDEMMKAAANALNQSLGNDKIHNEKSVLAAPQETNYYV
ncbi:hypothetical protein Alg130_11128 [Pyrenophora tritici-repentis]|nr:hypothetical protein Alg130_11128 [Pyrenophora tritici-repentis]